MFQRKLSIAFGVCAGVCLVAQAVPAPPPLATIVDDKKLADETQTVVMAGGGFAGGGPALGAVRFMTTEFGMEGKTVKGAPYSAQAVTETTQTLADGNHIVHKSTALLARDSEGRTRREQTLDAVGPWATGEAPPTMVFIHDPVAQVSYSLDSHSKTASKMDIISDAREMKMRAERKMMQATQSGAVVRSSEKAPAEDIVAESLGSKTIEGVVAEGKRFTRTVPAGQMGNEKPLVYVNETWYSSELQTLVMSKHSDPQFGETVYTLTNIQRAEPDASLFTVPADYTIKEGNKMVFLDTAAKPK